MYLQFKCHNCGEYILVKFLEVGQIAECKHCGAKNVVPQTATKTNEEPFIPKPEPESAQIIPKPEPEKTQEQKYYYTKDPTSLTRFLKTMLWVLLGICIISLLSNFMQMNLLSSGSFSQVEAEANDARQRIVGSIMFVAFILTFITFLIWIYRANLNCHGFGAQGMKFSPGWSIGCYFIPILHLYRPYQAMKEIWKISSNPANWQNEPGSRLLGLWWALWLISSFFGYLSLRMSMTANTIEAFQISTTILIISVILDILLYMVAVLLISAIFKKQENLVIKNV